MCATGPVERCVKFKLPVTVHDQSFDLIAASLDREKLGNNLLLGKNCPGLIVQWWITPSSKPIQQILETPTEIEQNKLEKKEQVNVLTRSQVKAQQQQLEEWERKDRISTLKPTSLESIPEDLPDKESSSSQSEGQRKRENPVQHIQAPAVDIAELIRLQKEDHTLQTMWQCTTQTDSTFAVSGGILVKRVQDEIEGTKDLIVIPISLRKNILKLAHNSLTAGHMGISNTKARASAQFYWPGLSTDIHRWCTECTECQRVNGIKRNMAPLQEVPVVEQPWSKVAMDVVGPLSRTPRGVKYMLTMICLATRYPEVVPLKAIDTESVLEGFLSVVLRHGVPHTLLTDCASDFTSELFKAACDRLSINKIESTPYRPESNGAIERLHSTLKRAIAKYPRSERDWDKLIPYVLFAIRDSPCRSTGFAPFRLMYGREVVGPLKLLGDHWLNPPH